MLDTLPHLQSMHFPKISRDTLDTLQVNLGYVCNQQCTHCHVNAGPKRKEIMTLDTIQEILRFLQNGRVKRIDLTGGAPEMNPHFSYLLQQATSLNVSIVDRCNLTILSEPGYEQIATLLAEYQVEVVASLPCYLEENVDKQRGKGVYERSIAGLNLLNQLGYGDESSGLTLNLVYNPVGAFLPPSQAELQKDYKRLLWERHQIRFNELLTITNMPIQRFGSALLSKGEFHSYMTLLKNAYQAKNLSSVMCRNLISVNWQGYLFDCDFNQMLDLPIMNANKKRLHISELNSDSLIGHPIVVKDHCFGCTAGQGSSCGGALSS